MPGRDYAILTLVCAEQTYRRIHKSVLIGGRMPRKEGPPMRKRILSLVLAMVMLMSMSTGMTLRDAVEGAETTPSADSTAMPENTAEPEAAVKPAPTETTEAPAEPEVIEPTEPTEAPETPAEPETTEEPEVTEDQAPTKEPEPTEAPEATEEPGEDGEADPAEEPADEVTPLALGLEEDQIMPVAAPAPFASISFSASYYEAYPYALSGNYVLGIRFTFSGGMSTSTFKTAIRNGEYTFKLTRPDGEPEELPVPTKYSDINTSVGWALDGTNGLEKISAPGEYTLTVTEKENPENTKDVTFTIIQVNFKATDKGQFSGGTDLYTGYGMKADSGQDYALQNNFLVSDPTQKEGGGDFVGFIGWASSEENAQSGTLITRVSQITEVDGNAYTVYAAYGEQSVSEYKYFDKDPTAETMLSPLPDYDYTLRFSTEYGATGDKNSKLTFWIKSTGNKPVAVNMPTSAGYYFTLKYEVVKGQYTDGKLEGGAVIEVTVTPREGLQIGTYTAGAYFGNYAKRLNLSVTVTPKTITIKPESKEKEYGQIIGAENVKVELIDAPSEVTFESLGVTLTSVGFNAQAKANESGYEYEMIGIGNNPNYKVELDKTNKVIVKKATPKGEVNASGIKVGYPLSASSLSGSFTNPNIVNTGWEVIGTLEWDAEQNGGEANAITPKIGEQTYHWKFTPDATHAVNYEGTSGVVTVTVSDKDPTTITLKPGQNLDNIVYDGMTHEAVFVADRPGDIKVEYKAEGASEWTTELPKAVGTYEVLATMEETADHARGELLDSLTIVPKDLHFTVSKPTKTYDGTTDATLEVATWGALPGEDAKVQAVNAQFVDANVGTNKTVTYTMEIVGADRANYKLYARAQGSHVGDIIPARLTVSGTVQKAYGAELKLTADMFTFKTTGTSPQEVTGLTEAQLTSPGTAYDANVGSYDVMVSLVSGNYQLAAGVATIKGGLTVEKVTPELLEGKVNVSSGKKGAPLSTVAITGTYVNPNNHDLVAEGTFDWVDPQETLPLVEQHSTYDAAWKFTLSEEAAKNYNPPAHTDKVTVTVLNKTPIALQADPVVEEYNGDSYLFEATVKQSGVDASKIELKYEYREHLELLPAWSDVPPVDAGVYDVKVTAKAGAQYAEDYDDGVMESTLTITQATPKTDGLKKS